MNKPAGRLHIANARSETPPIWDVTVFNKNRERLLDGDIADAFFQAVLQPARERNLLSDEHFTVDGTLLEAWANPVCRQS